MRFTLLASVLLTMHERLIDAVCAVCAACAFNDVCTLRVMYITMMCAPLVGPIELLCVTYLSLLCGWWSMRMSYVYHRVKRDWSVLNTLCSRRLDDSCSMCAVCAIWVVCAMCAVCVYCAMCAVCTTCALFTGLAIKIARVVVYFVWCYWRYGRHCLHSRRYLHIAASVTLCAPLVCAAWTACSVGPCWVHCWLTLFGLRALLDCVVWTVHAACRCWVRRWLALFASCAPFVSAGCTISALDAFA